MISDPYLDFDRTVNRLIEEHKAHKSLLIAVDFDYTITNFNDSNYKFNKLVQLVKDAKHKINATIIVFTANSNNELINEVFLKDLGFLPDFINESPVKFKTSKIYYNLLLDDRAGLSSAYNTLQLVINMLLDSNVEINPTQQLIKLFHKGQKC